MSVMTSLAVPGPFRKLTSAVTVTGFAAATPIESVTKTAVAVASRAKLISVPSIATAPQVTINPNGHGQFNGLFSLFALPTTADLRRPLRPDGFKRDGLRRGRVGSQCSRNRNGRHRDGHTGG